MRFLFYHPESEALFEIETTEQLEKLMESDSYDQLEDVTGRPQFEEMITRKKQDAAGIF